MDSLATWLLVLLAVLATARLTRLINDDVLLDRPRAAIQRTDRVKLAYFVTCPWCVSMYVGGGVAAAAYWYGDRAFVIVPLVALSASYVTGWLATYLLRAEEAD